MSGGAEIPSCAVDVAPDEMYGLLAEAGCLVVTGMATPAELSARCACMRRPIIFGAHIAGECRQTHQVKKNHVSNALFCVHVFSLFSRTGFRRVSSSGCGGWFASGAIL